MRIGNEALGIYGLSALGAAAWLGLWALQSGKSQRNALMLMCTVAGFAVIASGWPGFGAADGFGRQILPGEAGADGFYYAALIKR